MLVILFILISPLIFILVAAYAIIKAMVIILVALINWLLGLIT